MKCSRCGYDNPDYLEYCENCAAQLESNEAESAAAPSWGFVKAPRWPEPDFSADNVSDDDVPQDYGIEDGDEATVDLFANNTQQPARQETKDEANLEFEPAPKRANNQNAQAYNEAYNEEYDDLAGFYDEGRQQVQRKQPSKKPKNTYLIPIIIACAVAAIGLIVGIVILIAGRSPSGANGNKNESGIQVNPDDPSYYHVTVYANEGAVLVYETNDGQRVEATVAQGRDYLVFNVPVDTLKPTEPVDGTTYTATPKVYIKNADETLTPVEIGSVTIDVPALDISYNTETSLTTESGRVTIAGTIVQIAAAITVNGEPVAINEDGSFTYDVLFEETGTFTVVAEARMNGYQIARQSFNVTVTAPAVVAPTIQMPWEYGDTTFSQRVRYSIENMTVFGRVPVGSTVTVASQSQYVSFPAAPTVDETGTFRFQVNFSVAGDFVITITCTGTDGGVTTRDVHVQRSPDWSTYIQGAWAMSFAAFGTSSNQAYQIQGTVTEIIQEDDFLLARFTLSDGNAIVIEYHNHYGTAGSIEAGRTYSRIYGRPLGLNADGIPQFYVWFVEG